MKPCVHKRKFELEQGEGRLGQVLSSRGLVWCWWLGEVGNREAWRFLSPRPQGHSREVVTFHRIYLAFLSFRMKILGNLTEAFLICGLRWIHLLLHSLSCLFFSRISSYLILWLCFSTAHSAFWLSEVVNPLSWKTFSEEFHERAHLFFSVIFLKSLWVIDRLCAFICIKDWEDTHQPLTVLISEKGGLELRDEGTSPLSV